MSDWKGEYNVIRFPRAASGKSTLQRCGKTAKSSPELGKNHGIHDDDYDHRMLVNALAAAVLVMLVISGEWMFSTLAAIP
jgi:hypothetical protein